MDHRADDLYKVPLDFNLPDSVVLAVLYVLVAVNIAIYRIHMRRYPPDRDSSRYPVSAVTRSFRFVMPVLYLAVVADFPLALYVLRVDPIAPVRLATCFLLGIVSLLLLAWSLSALGANFASCYEGRLPAKVVRHGPYRLVDHPIYLANLLMLLGFNIALFNWPLFVISLLVFFFYAWAVVEEEQGLARLEETKISNAMKK